MKPDYKMQPNQLLSAIAGIFAVTIIDLSVESIHLTGPGLDGALRAAFWFGLVGGGGGLMAYEVVRRIRERLSSK